MEKEDHSLWVFGYGSLCWNPGFQYGDSVVGHIEGFSRKFWQGNTTHRGTEEKPGRVATLVEEKNSRTHGIAFQLLGENALSYLQNRECTLGGYVSHITTFHPRPSRRKRTPSASSSDSSTDSSAWSSPEEEAEAEAECRRSPFPVLLYVATPASRHWAGPAPLPEIAEQVVGCCGPSGHNVEYVLRLADWVRITLPDVMDDHLFTLESHIRFKIKEKNLCIKSMMREDCVDHAAAAAAAAAAAEEAANGADGAAAAAAAAAGAAGGAAGAGDDHNRPNTFAFASSLGRKGLRCCNA